MLPWRDRERAHAEEFNDARIRHSVTAHRSTGTDGIQPHRPGFHGQCLVDLVEGAAGDKEMIVMADFPGGPSAREVMGEPLKWKDLTDAFLSLLKSVNQLSRFKKGGRSYGADD